MDRMNNLKFYLSIAESSNIDMDNVKKYDQAFVETFSIKKNY